MKQHKVNYIVYLLIGLFLLQSLYVEGAKRRRSSANLGTGYINVWGGLGYSALREDFNGASTPGGAAGLFGLGYSRKINWFMVTTGLEFQYLSSTSKMTNYHEDAIYSYSTPDYTSHFDFSLNLPEVKDSYSTIATSIPLIFTADFGRRYFASIGAKYTFPVYGSTTTSVDWEATAVDPALVDGVFKDMKNHGFTRGSLESTSDMKLTTDLKTTFEVGVIIDEWMPKKYKKLKNKRKTKLSYRASLFCDYSFQDLNDNDAIDDVVNFPVTAPDGSVNMSDFDQMKVTNLASINWPDGQSSVMPLLVGVKLNVMFELYKRVKVVRVPRVRPKPKPRKPSTIPPEFIAKITNYDTQEPLDAHVILIDPISKDTVLSVQTNKFGTNEPVVAQNKKYLISVIRPGFIDYTDTIYQVVSDTIYVDIQPIEVNTTVVLNNLFFETAKTEINNGPSQETLEFLYDLLVKNPNIRIMISGHTDTVGKRRYNMKLSLGRAQAVKADMVKRGVDASRMEVEGIGPDEPIDTNDTPEGRANNRRVEITIL